MARTSRASKKNAGSVGNFKSLPFMETFKKSIRRYHHN